jgi:predicted adenylyl cyclase CyaB
MGAVPSSGWEAFRMPVNIEVKARVADRDRLIPVLESLAIGRAAEELEQDDTFFACDAGRLKLRILGDGRGQLIFYQRPDTESPSPSTYSISETSDPDALRAVLAQAYGVVGRVRKHRTLLIVGRTRIHLDRVEGMGDFLELEVTLSDGDSVEAATTEAEHLLATLGVHKSELVPTAYVDLLRNEA